MIPQSFVDGGESEVQNIVVSNYRASSFNKCMQRVIGSRTVKIASHIPSVDVVKRPEVPASLNAADPSRNSGGVSVSIEGPVVPDVPWIP